MRTNLGQKKSSLIRAVRLFFARMSTVYVFVSLVIAFIASFIFHGNSYGKPSGKCSKSLKAAGKLTREQTASQEELDSLAKRFVDYCSTDPNMSGDRRVINLTARWNRQVLLSDFPGDASNVMGSFNKESGCLMLRDMKEKPLSEQLGIMLHELAHSNGWNHDDEWRDCFLFFANVATEKLGWVVAMKCPTACKNYQVCSKSQCPLCDFLDWDKCGGGNAK